MNFDLDLVATSNVSWTTSERVGFDRAYSHFASEGVVFTPYPVKLSRARVVDETAPTTVPNLGT